MTTDNNTIKTMNNKLSSKIRTVDANKSLSDGISADIQAYLGSGGKIEQVASHQCNQATIRMKGVTGLMGMIG